MSTRENIRLIARTPLGNREQYHPTNTPEIGNELVLLIRVDKFIRFKRVKTFLKAIIVPHANYFTTLLKRMCSSKVANHVVSMMGFTDFLNQ